MCILLKITWSILLKNSSLVFLSGTGTYTLFSNLFNIVKFSDFTYEGYIGFLFKSTYLRLMAAHIFHGLVHVSTIRCWQLLLRSPVNFISNSTLTACKIALESLSNSSCSLLVFEYNTSGSVKSIIAFGESFKIVKRFLNTLSTRCSALKLFTICFNEMCSTLQPSPDSVAAIFTK